MATGGGERLADGARSVAQTAARQDVAVVWEEYEAMPHLWPSITSRECRRNLWKETLFEKLFKIFLTKIKKFPKKNSMIIRVRKQLKSFIERKICVNREWSVNKKNLLRYFHVVYVFEETFLRFALLRLYYDDSLTRYYKSKKILILLEKNFIYKEYERTLMYTFKNIKYINERRRNVITFMTNSSRCLCSLAFESRFLWNLLRHFSLIVMRMIYTTSFSS